MLAVDDDLFTLGMGVARELSVVTEWTASDFDNPDVVGFYLTRASDGLRLHARRDWQHPDRIVYSPSWPRPTRGDIREFWPPGDIPKITVGAGRGAVKHAQEIARRLLPAATEGLAYVRDRMMAAVDRADKALGMIEQIEALGITVHQRDGEPGGWIPDVPGAVKIEDGGRVRFDRIVLGDEQAVELIELLHRFYTEGAR